MRGRKRNVAVTLPTVHLRLATEVNAKATVAMAEVDDPLEPGAKIIVFKNLRDDPLGRYEARGHIDSAQASAGRAWQDDYEASEIGGARAVDTTKEPVDGGSFPEPITDKQIKALKRLADDRQALGMEGEAIVRDFLGRRMFAEQVAAVRGFTGQRNIDYFSKRLRECLETLAVVRGFAMRSKNHTRG